MGTAAAMGEVVPTPLKADRGFLPDLAAIPEEIGEMLEVTAGTSKSQLHRARMALRQYLS